MSGKPGSRLGAGTDVCLSVFGLRKIWAPELPRDPRTDFLSSSGSCEKRGRALTTVLPSFHATSTPATTSPRLLHHPGYYITWLLLYPSFYITPGTTSPRLLLAITVREIAHTPRQKKRTRPGVVYSCLHVSESLVAFVTTSVCDCDASRPAGRNVASSHWCVSRSISGVHS